MPGFQRARFSSVGRKPFLNRVFSGLYSSKGERCRIIQVEEEIVEIRKRLGMIHLGGNRVFFRPSNPNNFEPDEKWFLTHGVGDVILSGE